MQGLTGPVSRTKCSREQACKFALRVLSSLDLNRSRRYKFPLTETTRVEHLLLWADAILLCYHGERRNLNVYKFAATCDYGDSIRRDVADLWVSSAAWPPLRASCNLVHYVRSLIHRFSFVASKASTSQLRACVAKGAAKEPRQKWLEKGFNPWLLKRLRGKVNFYGPVYVKKLWSGTASWIFQWMIKRREPVWWKIWRISSLSFLLFPDTTKFRVNI